MATMIDVARKAGVSLSTVSHVINGTRFVMPRTEALVREAIAAMDFRPNVLARALVRDTTDTVGIAISLSTNHYFLDIISAIDRACTALGQMVMLGDTQNDPDAEFRVVRELAQRRVDGIILAPSAAPERSIAFLESEAIPFVLVDRIVSDDIPGVALENSGAMVSLVDHLVWHGHRRIALIAGEPGLRSTTERTGAFREAMARHGFAVPDELIHAGNATSEEARASALRLFALPERPTAIASGNNLATIGIMKAVRDAGLEVPRDLALIGFDDFEWANCFEPRLTVIAQPSEEIGKRAAEMLAARIAKAEIRPAPLRLPSRLVVRHSCGCGG